MYAYTCLFKTPSPPALAQAPLPPAAAKVPPPIPHAPPAPPPGKNSQKSARLLRRQQNHSQLSMLFCMTNLGVTAAHALPTRNS